MRWWAISLCISRHISLIVTAAANDGSCPGLANLEIADGRELGVRHGRRGRDFLKRAGWLPLKTIESTYSRGFDGFEGRGTGLSVNSAVDGMLHQ